MNHTYDGRACPACGDMDGCHVPGKVSRRDPGFGRARPKVVCLCGSTRFGDAFRDAMRAETLEGNIVLSVGLLGHAEGLDMDGPLKAMLDELHKRKIDAADEVLILNVRALLCMACGKPCEADFCAVGATGSSNSKCCRAEVAMRPYVGKSTRSELEYARAAGKVVRFLEPEVA